MLLNYSLDLIYSVTQPRLHSERLPAELIKGAVDRITLGLDDTN